MADNSYQCELLMKNLCLILGYAGNIRMIDDEDEVGQKDQPKDTIFVTFVVLRTFGAI